MSQDHAPDFGRGFLRVPLSVWAALYCRAPLTRRQLQLVSVVIRESWGWQKPGGEVYRWTRPLTPCQFAALTGLSTDHLARDLKALVEQGVLREEGGRYELVANPALWKTPASRTPKVRPEAPKSPERSAESALLPPGLKIENGQQRNVGGLTREQLSPAVERSSLTASSDPEQPIDPVPVEQRFFTVVDAFVGGLAASESECLHDWLRQDSIQAVWQELADTFRHGPSAVRACLKQRFDQTRDRQAS
jgi:hypothetical protein